MHLGLLSSFLQKALLILIIVALRSITTVKEARFFYLNLVLFSRKKVSGTHLRFENALSHLYGVKNTQVNRVWEEKAWNRRIPAEKALIKNIHHLFISRVFRKRLCFAWHRKSLTC